MNWIVSHSPNYPKLHQIKKDVINNIFEKIFDSKSLDENQKINLWNSEVDNVIKNVIGGINCNISWPPCSIDDSHEMVKNEVLPPSSWNSDNQRNEILSSLTNLKIVNKLNNKEISPKRHIIQAITKLEPFWWTMAEVATTTDLFVDSSLSDASTFPTFTDSSLHHQHQISDKEESVSSRSTVQLIEFDQLVNDISDDFEKTL